MLVLCSNSTPQTYLAELQKQQIEYIVCGQERVDLRAALEALNVRHGVSLVRVDRGGTLNGALPRAGLVNEISLLIHPRLVGGTTPNTLFQAPDLTSAAGVISLHYCSPVIHLLSPILQQTMGMTALDFARQNLLVW